MKTLLIIIFSLLQLPCLGQTQASKDTLYDLTLAYRPAVIKLWSDSIKRTSTINNGNISKMTYSGLPPGQYKVEICGQGQATVLRDSLTVGKEQNLVLRFTFNGPCLYDHAAGYIPICPKNHTDNIISIVYGLVANRADTFIKNKKDMKMKYAGCVTTGCDPKFYCKEHNIEF